MYEIDNSRFIKFTQINFKKSDQFNQSVNGKN